MKHYILIILVAILPSCKGNVCFTGLGPVMEDVFSAQTISDEIVMFMDYGQEKTLLFDADEIISVKSYDNRITYVEGKDYALKDGKITLLEGSAIPCITSEGYYGGITGASRDFIKAMHDGREVSIYWGEEHYMADWQVRITYTHSDTWTGFRQPSWKDQYTGLLKKFEKGEDVTIIWYGDSITHGCTSSMIYGYEPYMPSFAMLVAESLAAAYDYDVVFTDVSELPGTPMIPGDSESYGGRGALRYINTAVGGWNSTNGIEHFDKYVGDFIKEYGCDLFVIGYGMNDGHSDASVVAENIRAMAGSALALDDDASLLVISTMLPNPTATNGWYGLQHTQEPELLKLAEQFRSDGKPCAVAQMTSVSESVLKRKEFQDISGNNINHPNDFFARIYAQTILRTITGY